MSKTNQEPKFVAFDVAQWRRDIQAFATTTQRALEAISAELSTHCSGNQRPLGTQPTTPRNEPTETVETKTTTPSKKPNATDKTPQQPTRAIREASTTNTNSPADDRLSKLKERIARRLGN
ncbi:MAG: hypothetical protein AAFN77_07665 [Planctomycetota bacterium]